MKKVAFLTLGCRVNQYETQVIAEGLFSLGFEKASFEETCDLYVVNTCAVTGESERKGRQAIRRALRQKEKNQNAVVCVCGCFSQGVSDPVFSQVDVVTGNTGKGSLAPLLARLCDTPPALRERLDLRENIDKVKCYEEMGLSFSHNARAFVKIQDGCNSFCSYCFVPFVRGRVRSRSVEEIAKEVVRLCRNGYREVVLTGIETGSYGEDLPSSLDLAGLVEAIHDTPGLERIRFGSLKPSVFREDFLSRLSVLEKVMPHFHLSLQSGSDSVLSAMGRRYGRKEEEAATEAIYRCFPDAGLSADLIVGFPGEREEDFLESVSLVKKAGLLHTHIFPYSPRKGTRAASFDGQLPPEEKKRRAAYLLETAKNNSLAFGKQREGKRYRILCERIRDGYAFGYTENFIYTKTPVTQQIKVGECFSAVLGTERRFAVETMTVLCEKCENG